MIDVNLKCPKCGFAFGAMYDDDEPDDVVQEIWTCPCGTLMEETDELEVMVIDI